MKTVEETRRELFEAALHRDWAAHLVVLDREGDGYVFGDIDSAWWAFSAALDAVVIELPEKWGEYSEEGYHFCAAVDECREAIESTNLGIKVK